MKETIEKLFSKKSSSGLGNSEANIETSGSNTGLKKLLNGKSDFALVAFDIETALTEEMKVQWEEKKIKVLTLAQDPVVLVYKKPSSCYQEMILDAEKFKALYSLFTGHKFESTTSDLKDLMEVDDEKCSASIISFARNGGAKKSGAAYAFLYSNPIWKTIEKELSAENGEKKKWVDKVKESVEGNDFSIKFAPENNTLAFQNFVHELKDGHMIYLPASFVFNNEKEIKKYKLSIAQYKENGTAATLNKSNLQTNNNYKWLRNLNLLYPTNEISERHKIMINFLSKETKSLKEINLIPIIYNSSGTNTTNKTITANVLSPDNDCNKYGFTNSTCPTESGKK